MIVVSEVIMEDRRRERNFGRLNTARSLWNELTSPYSKVRKLLPEIHGIDISKWNGTGDFSVTKGKVNFVYVRGGYGTYIDEKYALNSSGLRVAGIPYGIYWFVYPHISMDAQISTFLSVLQTDGGWVLPPVADFETTTLNASDTTAWIKLFMEKLQAKIATKLMIYTSAGWWNSHVLRNTWAKNYYLWAAHWTTASTPILPLDWTECFFWQYSGDNNGKAAYYGFSGGDPDMDENRCMDAARFNELVYGITPPPEPLPDGALYKAVVTADTLNVRIGPNTYNDVIKTLVKGTIIYVYEEYKTWAKIEKTSCRWVSMDWIRRV